MSKQGIRRRRVAAVAVAARPASMRPKRALAAGLAYVPALMIAIAGWSHRWLEEDAFINFRIVDQIFAGHGPVFNAGERVEAATSPLWLGLLVAARALFGSFVRIEWITVIVGLLVAVMAFAIGGYGALVLHRGSGGVVVPVGLVLVASVAVVWDFATSGLEIGLAWLWIAASWLALVSVARSERVEGRGRFIACVVLGLAPLVRPELGLMMVCFLVAWFALAKPRRLAFDLTAIFALPVAYEIFRMGYYAAVVPNTALAKDAGALHVRQGWAYAKDFIGPYRLWLPAAIIAAIVVYRHATEGDRRIKIVTAAMLAAAATGALYIIATGGDYMHGRLLLPAFFALGLPASVALRRDAFHTLALAGAGAAWATLSVFAFRPPVPAPFHGFGVHPVADWRALLGARLVPKDAAFGPNGFEAAAEYRNGVRGYFEVTDKQPRAAKDRNAYVLTLGSIGVPAYHAGVRIWIVDISGLAEPLAARAPPIAGRVAGHRKDIDAAWYDARFGAAAGDAKVIAARHALTCGPLPGLLASLNASLTPGRFLSNIWHSFDYTFLTLPADPAVAERRWCRHR